MKPRALRFFPQTLVICVSPILACATASASVVNYNEANATGLWNVPSGTNLLTGATAVATSPTPASPAPPPVIQESATSNSWATLSDGVLGTPGGTSPPYKSQTVAPVDGVSVIYALDLTGHPDGYDLTSFDSYCIWGDANRDNQNYALQASTDGVSYTTVAVVDNRNTLKATHTSLTDTSGVLASGIKYVKIIFGSAPALGQENGYTGFSEFVLLASPTKIYTDIESNTTNNWTLPAGTNLLNGATATPSTLDTREGSSPNWSTVTNGILGTPGDNSSSVTPLNNTSVIFPLNTLVNFNGYNLSSIDTYCAWINSGRDNQDLVVSYSKVGAESVFLPLAYPSIHTGGDNATHIRLSPDAGFLATGVSAIKFSFPNQENGYVGFREFIALGTAVSISTPLTWTGGSGSAGTATWVGGTDNNWKQTVGGAPAVYNVGAGLTFGSVATNNNITVSTPLTAFSMGFTNDISHPYTFGGGLITVSNEIVSSGAGSATFNNAVKTSTGVSLSDAGSLVFNGALESTSLSLTETASGGITLNAANPALTGTAVVSGGTLTVANNSGLQNSALSMNGGTALFTSSVPLVRSISSLDTVPGIVLGNPSGTTNLSVGDAASVTAFAGAISEASGTTGRLTKTGGSSLSLSGTNTYTGTTTVSGGTLQLTQRLSLYNGGLAAPWTAGNIIVASGATLGFDFGTSDEFTTADLNSGLSLDGFASGSSLGINTPYEDLTLSRNLTQTGLGLIKTGRAILNLTGTNTSNGPTRIFLGTINAASTGGTSIGGSVQIGNGSGLVYLNMGASNQLGSGSVVTFANGNFYNAAMNLRGTSQTIAGLDAAPFPANKIIIVQNDEIGHPGYTVDPGAASLTINATTDHSFTGIIRNQNGGALSLVKNGPGTQELINLSGIADYQYSGSTTVNQGRLKISFSAGNNGFSSNVTVNSPLGVPATLEFHAVTGDLNFDREISGEGHVEVNGVNAVRIRNNNNSWSGGLTVGLVSDGTDATKYKGYLALIGDGNAGAGTASGQHCAAGMMIPSNLITVHNGATLALDGPAALGHSTVLPQFAPSVRITEFSSLSGGSNTIAFVSNITLDGGKIEIRDGTDFGGFNSNLTLVGTLVVGGVSTVPAEIKTLGTGPNANASLGSGALPGTVFQVADITPVSADTDLIVSSILRNVGNAVSPLTKTGLGTMLLSGANTYTGDTTVTGGELTVSGNSIADTNKLVINGGKLGVAAAANETVSTLYFGSVQQLAGTYGSTTSSATYKDDTHFSGTGIVTVAVGPVTDPYELWSASIPNPGDRGRTADPDGDGFSNLSEYLFGTSPTASNGSLSTFEKTGPGLIVRWNQRATGSSVYVLRESATMAEIPWPTSTAAITDNATQGLTDYVRKEAIIPVNSARKFVRVEATE